MITIEQLVSFKTVFEQGSYSAAGREIHKDRSTIREHILALEDNIGFPLFVIQGKQAKPTDSAFLLYPRAKAITLQTTEFSSLALLSFDQHLTELTIHYDAIVGNTLITVVDKEMFKLYPLLKINWLHRNRDDSLQQMQDTLVDLTIMPSNREIITNMNISFCHLGAMALNIYCNATHPFADNKNLTLRDLELEKQIALENMNSSPMRWMCFSTQMHTVSNMDLLLSMLQHQGWAVLPESVAETHIKQGNLVKLTVNNLLNAYQQNIGLYYPAKHRTNKMLQQLITLFSQHHALL